MRFKGLDLNLLLVFDALVTEKNVTRAAERLCLSQSATSSALARLRGFFNDELLIANGRTYKLSARAETLYPVIKSLIAQLEQKIVAPSAFDPQTANRSIRVMASDYATVVMLGQGLAKIAQQAPGLAFEIRASDARPEVWIERHDIDLLIAPEPLVSPMHPSMPYFEDDYVCVVTQANTCCADTLALEQYLNMTHVLVRFGSREFVQPFDERFLASMGLRKKVAVVSPSYATLPYYILGTDRIMTVHRRLAQEFVQRFPLRMLPVPISIPPMRAVIQWPVFYQEDAVLQWVCGQLVAAAKSAPTLAHYANH